MVIIDILGWARVMYYLRRSIGRIIIDDIILVELDRNVYLLLGLCVAGLSFLIPSCR